MRLFPACSIYSAIAGYAGRHLYNCLFSLFFSHRIEVLGRETRRGKLLSMQNNKPFKVLVTIAAT